METTPCDIHEYDSKEYNNCIKDIVYEAAQDEWIMLDPRFPNLKGITPKRIDEFLANAETQGMKKYFEDYLQHVMVYDRDDIISMCYDLGQQIEKLDPDALHSPHTIFVTTPRGGHEVLSIFAYTNDLKKEQLPSHIRSIDKYEYELAKKKVEKEEKLYEDEDEEYDKYDEYDEDEEDEIEEYYGGHYPFYEEEELAVDIDMDDQSVVNHYNKGNYPTIPNIWLPTDTFYLKNHILRVFIIDDIIASGDQMSKAYIKIEEFFKNKTEIPVQIIPIVLVKAKDIKTTFSNLRNTLYADKTVGIEKWDEARDVRKGYDKDYSFNRKLHIDILDYDKLITVRFPWGSPDGESDKILTTLYESRRGLERIERKQRRCRLEPDKCELK